MCLPILYILGDIGFYGNILQSITSHIKNVFTPIDKIVLLGDNFYLTGVSSIHDLQWINYEFFFKDFGFKNIYGIMGNHDYYQNPLSQINSNYFNNNELYFKRSFTSDTDLFFIDTVQLFKNHCNITSMDMLRIHNKSFNELEEIQLEWLDNELKKSNVKNKIVFGHYPIMSNGVYAHDLLPLQKKLLPIFKKHNVKVYVSGHEHNIQYIERQIDEYKFNQFIIGCSSHIRPDEYKRKNIIDMYYNNDNFYLKIIEDEKKNLLFEFYNKNNVIKYSYLID